MATKVISGTLREVWQSSAPLNGGGLENLQTGIRCSATSLSRVQAVLTVTAVVGSPAINAFVSIVGRKVMVTIANTAAAGNTASWSLDITLNHSFQQTDGSAAPPVIIVVGATALGSVQGDVPAPGSALPNADVVINPDTDAAARYVLPVATLTAPHKVTITPGGVITLPLMGRIVRADHSVHDYTVENGGINGAAAMSVVLPTPPAGKNLALDWVWDGTDFISNGVIYLIG